MKEDKFVITVKYRQTNDTITPGVPVGTLWKRLNNLWRNTGFSDWREAKGFELELYYSGNKRIPDFSKL